MRTSPRGDVLPSLSVLHQTARDNGYDLVQTRAGTWWLLVRDTHTRTVRPLPEQPTLQHVYAALRGRTQL